MYAIRSYAINQRVSAYTVTKTAIQAAGATVTFYVTDVNDGNLYSQAFTTSSPTLMADIATFFIAHTDASDSANIFIDTNTLYIGYLSTDLVNAVGLNAPTQIYSDKSIGTKHSDINVTAVETGYNEVLVGDIVNVTPTLTFGYVGVTNLTEFFAGSEVETDAEYRDRFNSVLDEATAATRSAIFKRVSDLANVEKVKIYDNPTDTPTAETGDAEAPMSTASIRITSYNVCYTKLLRYIMDLVNGFGRPGYDDIGTDNRFALTYIEVETVDAIAAAS